MVPPEPHAAAGNTAAGTATQTDRAEADLSGRALRAGLWGSISLLTLRVLSLARVFVLARLLTPGAFGLVGIALATLGLAETITKRNVKSALIQRPGDIRPYLDTAWTMGLILSGAIAGILFLAADLIALFFSAPESAWIIRVMAITVWFRETSNIGVVYFEKELEFKRRFTYYAAFMAVDVAVSIVMALVLRNAWAIVAGAAAGSVTQVVVSYLIHPYKPRLWIDWEKAKEIFGFSRWIMGSGALIYLMLNLDSIVVGRVLGVVPLGLYRMAQNLTRAINVEFAGVISDVAFPTYSKLQGDVDRLRRAFLRTVQWTGLLMMPLSGGVAVLASDIVRLALGREWIPMSGALQILAVWGGVWAVGMTFGPLFQAMGRPELGTRHQIVRVILLVSLIYPLTKLWGLEGTATAMLIAAAGAYPFALWQAGLLAGFGPVDYLKALLVPMAATAAMAAALLTTMGLMGRDRTLVDLTLLLVLGGAVYCGSVLLTDVLLGSAVRSSLRDIFLRARRAAA